MCQKVAIKQLQFLFVFCLFLFFKMFNNIFNILNNQQKKNNNINTHTYTAPPAK